ncbi:MAG: trypsin-like peptidase domain-containing protein [Planctomycetes bacterium]|nr:trypsin-like peptidase domain-containing protein [Planctomycetota bacterium]
MSALTLALAIALFPQLPGDALQEEYGLRLTPEARVYQKVAPSVVRVELWGLLGVEAKVGGRSFDANSYVKMSTGSGVIYTEDGLVLTNSHVITPTSDVIDPEKLRVRVLFSPEFESSMGEIEFDAKVLKQDLQWDLALLQIESNQVFQAAPFGRSSDLLIGERVIALGAQYEGSLSLSAGMLSGLNRQVTMRLEEDVFKTFQGMIQTDAAVNAGSSGGPLLNIYGELIGINVATLGDSEGVSFAIPVDRIHNSLSQDLMRGSFWAGMTVGELSDGGSPVVTSLHPRGPAFKAGLKIGDRILSVDQKPVPSVRNYQRHMREKKPDQTLVLLLYRQGKSMQIQVPLMAWSARDGLGLLGMNLQRQELIFAGQDGSKQSDVCLLINKIFEGSPASRLGLEAGDRILAVRVESSKAVPDGWTRVRSVSELVSLVRGPTFLHGVDNVWILRQSESFYGRLIIDDPEVANAVE